MNELNDLSLNEWVQWTKTCWITDYPLDSTWKLRKECKTTKSPQAMRDIITFFTKENDRVLDIFAGTGSTLIGARLCNRKAVGIEINSRLCQIFEQIKKTYIIKGGIVAPTFDKVSADMWSSVMMINDDSLKRIPLLTKESVDLVLCDPPHGPQEDAEICGELGASKNVETFVDQMVDIGEEVYRVLRSNKYWVIVMGDRYQDGEYVPLTYRLATKLQECGFKLNAIKVWINQASQSNLKAYKIGDSFVPNIVHDNLIILRKE